MTLSKQQTFSKQERLTTLKARWMRMQNLIANPEATEAQKAEAKRIAERTVKMRDALIGSKPQKG